MTFRKVFQIGSLGLVLISTDEENCVLSNLFIFSLHENYMNSFLNPNSSQNLLSSVNIDFITCYCKNVYT